MSGDHLKETSRLRSPFTADIFWACAVNLIKALISVVLGAIIIEAEEKLKQTNNSAKINK